MYFNLSLLTCQSISLVLLRQPSVTTLTLQYERIIQKSMSYVKEIDASFKNLAIYVVFSG